MCRLPWHKSISKPREKRTDDGKPCNVSDRAEVPYLHLLIADRRETDCSHYTAYCHIVTPPSGEPVKIPVVFSVGAIFSSSNPTCGEWSVCVETGTLTLTLETTDRIDAIIRYKENGVSRLTSNPPFSGIIQFIASSIQCINI